eukprot:5291126-Amphidinium_carterae.1
MCAWPVLIFIAVELNDSGLTHNAAKLPPQILSKSFQVMLQLSEPGHDDVQHFKPLLLSEPLPPPATPTTYPFCSSI